MRLCAHWAFMFRGDRDMEAWGAKPGSTLNSHASPHLYEGVEASPGEGGHRSLCPEAGSSRSGLGNLSTLKDWSYFYPLALARALPWNWTKGSNTRHGICGSITIVKV